MHNLHVFCLALQSGRHMAATITSEDLEKRFQEDNKAVIEFTAGSQTYELSFPGEHRWRDIQDKPTAALKPYTPYIVYYEQICSDILLYVTNWDSFGWSHYGKTMTSACEVNCLLLQQLCSFSDMIQTNKQYCTKKVVRRRPVFVSSADAQTIKTR